MLPGHLDERLLLHLIEQAEHFGGSPWSQTRR
jgi:hypothetical protein